MFPQNHVSDESIKYPQKHYGSTPLQFFPLRRSICLATLAYVVEPYLRTGKQVHVPFLVPRGPLGQLPGSDKPHNVGYAIIDETDLAAAFCVRTVETRTADGSFFDENQSGTVRLPAKGSV